MITAAVFDLDGTLSDERWRRVKINMSLPNPKARYHSYHCAAEEDNLMNEHYVAQAIANGHRIIFATARPALHTELTDRWLQRHFPGLSYLLFMRAEDSVSISPVVKLGMMREISETHEIVIVYDDRADVLDKLNSHNFNAQALPAPESQEAPPGPADQLRAMALTCEERQGMYGEVWRVVPRLVEVLFPNGVPPWLLTDPRWHLFELMLVKIARFAHSELRHKDSIHDAGVFCALVEHVIHEEEQINE